MDKLYSEKLMQEFNPLERICSSTKCALGFEVPQNLTVCRCRDLILSIHGKFRTRHKSRHCQREGLVVVYSSASLSLWQSAANLPAHQTPVSHCQESGLEWGRGKEEKLSPEEGRWDWWCLQRATHCLERGRSWPGLLGHQAETGLYLWKQWIGRGDKWEWVRERPTSRCKMKRLKFGENMWLWEPWFHFPSAWPAGNSSFPSLPAERPHPSFCLCNPLVLVIKYTILVMKAINCTWTEGKKSSLTCEDYLIFEPSLAAPSITNRTCVQK